MLSFTKTTDYALIALACLAEQPGRVWSAREVARTGGLSLALVMKVLKTLGSAGVLASVRGAAGGYRLQADLEQVSVLDLLDAMDSVESEHECDCGSGLSAPPLVALNYKLRRFLRDVRVSDLVVAGRRIDVPLERVRGRDRSAAAARVAVLPA